MNLDFASLNIISIIPMIITLLGAIGILVLDLIIHRFYRGIYVSLSAIILALSLTSVCYMEGLERGFFGFIINDGFAILAQMIILATSIFFIFLTFSKNSYREFECAEFYSLFLFMIAGYQFMVASNNLIVIFLGLEASSLALYALIALSKKDKGIEAGLKYFTLGAVGSGFFAFGIVFIYASVGSLDIVEFSANLSNAALAVNESNANIIGNKYFILLGFVFLLGAVGFKLSFFPFHSWVPDIYEGANPPLAFYMSIATKMAAFIVAIRIFGAFIGAEFSFFGGEVDTVLFIIIILTTTIPNIIALVQNDVQRMLAYSSISQAGFGLACIFVGTPDGLVSLFLYWILFAFSNLGAFGLLWLTHNQNYVWDVRFDSPYSKFSGLIKTSPLIAIAFAVFMLSLGGIPPFGLFWGKIFVVSSAINSGHIALALILLLNSAIAIYYYIKLIIFMFLKEPLNIKPSIYTQNASVAIIAVVAIAFIVCVGAIAFLGMILADLGQYIVL